MESLLSKDQPVLTSPTVDEQLVIAYGAMKRLGWEPKYAGPYRLTGFTPRNVFSGDEEVMAEVQDGVLSFSSRANYVKAVWNATKADKKNVKRLQDMYEQTQKLFTPEKRERWQKALNQLREYTQTVAEEEKKLDEELEKVMHISTGSRIVTFSLLGINVLYFMVMAIAGVGIFEPSSEGLIQWGANYTPYTLSGEWWRLFTSMFIHIGVIHLLFNMYALFLIGAYIEPMLGVKTFTTAYICTGIAATFTSIWWHDSNMVGAGASGAIFGMYGVFLALLSTNLIPKKARKEMLTSIGVMVGYNLIYGLKDGVDNAAHIGGLLSGLAAGYLIFLGIRKPTLKTAVILLLLMVTTVGTVAVLKTQHNDTLAYETSLKQFYAYETQALAPFDVIEAKQLDGFKSISLPTW
ncbi:MAG TPA: rhomboid family intramembrane serine protease, partial [Flavisolibacter sp.]|nr:rhomboid family intramembrane serine protease [Flavisolibacter sp.]